MYRIEESFNQKREILASDHYISFTITLKKDDVEPNNHGRRIIKAGTVYPSNDNKAEGLILNDIDVTYGDQPAALLVEGYIYEGRLPEKISDEALEAMPGIRIRTTFDE